MRNIHILPTEKPSRLIKSKINDTIVLEPINVTNNTRYWEYLNIYITSDEEIRKGDWCYLNKDGKEYVYKCTEPPQNPKNWGLKIILTTDTDLIEDGVQTIDDDFLVWFVMNPSCESVEIYRSGNHYDGAMEFYHPLFYKTIIPKEEPKKETLEEVAERLYPTTIDSFTDNGFDLSERERLIFINGAKWQQEQDKKLYSEEEVLKILESLIEHPTKPGYKRRDIVKFIEQFKKK
jgi:hypothetical protein